MYHKEYRWKGYNVLLGCLLFWQCITIAMVYDDTVGQPFVGDNLSSGLASLTLSDLPPSSEMSSPSETSSSSSSSSSPFCSSSPICTLKRAASFPLLKASVRAEKTPGIDPVASMEACELYMLKHAIEGNQSED